MKLGKKAIFSLLLGFDLLANILELIHFNFLYISTLLSFCTCILLPGFLISFILRIRRVSFWENLLFIIGLSIAFLEFGGLLLNILLPLFGITNPLAFQNIIIGFDIYILLLFIFAWIRTKPFIIQISGQSALIVGSGSTELTKPGQFMKLGLIDLHYRELANVDTITSLPIQLPRHPNIGKILYALPVFFPILAILGAIVLNNGGSDILTLILLGMIAFYSLSLVLLRNKISDNLYPYALFFIGMSILFTTSLRSWYISGHDVEREFYVFQLTNTHHIWNMAFYQDAYNACLSITILPTVLTNLLSIPDIYIYKIIFQILFALSPVLVFFIIRNYTMPVLAFLSAFFFLSFPTFFNDMPMLNRQEIGFIFFGLLLYIMLLSTLPLVMRRILFVIFALSVIVSHYSTNFVVLALVLFVYVLTLIISRSFMKNLFFWLASRFHFILKNTFPNKAFLNLPLILFLFSMTYLWNTIYTNTSNHTGSVIVEVVSSIFVQSNARSDDLAYSIFSHAKQDPKQQLQDYIQSTVQAAGSTNSGSGNTSQFYSKSVIDKYPSYPLPQEQLAPTPLGNWLTSLHIPVFNIQAELRSLSASFMQIFVFVGLIAIILLKNKRIFDLLYILISTSSLFLLVIITILPALSVEYGILRMFQQLLFLLSLPIVIGLYSVAFFMKEPKRVLFTGIIAIIFFLNLTGFISHLTGDYFPQMTLDNAGAYYDSYYVHKSDVFSIIWLSKNNVNHNPVEADVSGANKVLVYGNMITVNEILPAVILKDAYVYLEVSNHIEVSINKDILFYNSSKKFLDDNKNLIYSNGNNNIYR